MSIEDARYFTKMITAVEAAKENSAEDIADMAREDLDLDFDADELRKAFKDLKAVSESTEEGELDEDQLEDVAGGTSSSDGQYPADLITAGFNEGGGGLDLNSFDFDHGMV